MYRVWSIQIQTDREGFFVTMRSVVANWPSLGSQLFTHLRSDVQEWKAIVVDQLDKRIYTRTNIEKTRKDYYIRSDE
jgi:hypothetical protein